MNEIQIIAPKSIEETEKLSATLAKSSLLPNAIRGKAADIMATILAGAELGLAPMQSLRGIVVIQGKPCLSADTMGALCQRRPDVCEYLLMRESTPTRAVYETKRRGHTSPTTMAFSSDDAARAGLTGDNWRKYPAAMLRARALSAICRAVYPDLCLGLYDPDELQPEPQTKRDEKDITPTIAPLSAQMPISPAKEAKAQLEQCETYMAESGAVVVPHEGLTRFLAVESAKPQTPAPGPTLFARIKVLLERHELRGQPAADLMLAATGKTSRKELVEDDYGRIEAAIVELEAEDVA